MRTCSRFVLSPVKTPRATLVPLPPSRCSEKLQKMMRSRRKFGLKATSRSPPCPRAVMGGKPPCPLAADTPPEPTGSNPPIGCPISPFAETMRSFPVFSVIKRSPSGNGSTAQGLSKPFAKTVTSKATLDFTAQARVCPGKAGFCSGAFAVLVSSGAHDEVEAGGAADEAEGLTASRGFCAQATPTTIIKTVRTDAI